MNKEEHKECHVRLHSALDELMADYLLHNPDSLLGAVTAMELIEWSCGQTVCPSELYAECSRAVRWSTCV